MKHRMRIRLHSQTSREGYGFMKSEKINTVEPADNVMKTSVRPSWGPTKMHARSSRKSEDTDVICYRCGLKGQVKSCSAPRLWNSLPPHIKQSDTITTFKSQLKTHLFKLAHNVELITVFIVLSCFCFIVLFFYLLYLFFYFHNVLFFKRFMMTICSVRWPWVSWKAPLN